MVQCLSAETNETNPEFYIQPKQKQKQKKKTGRTKSFSDKGKGRKFTASRPLLNNS